MKISSALVALAVVVGGVLVGSPAAADNPGFGLVAGVGSGHTQGAMEAVGRATEPLITSYAPTGSATIKTKAVGCVFPRPQSANEGVQALRASEGEDIGQGPGVFKGANVLGCVDFARVITPAAGPAYTAVPLGVSAVTIAINNNGDLPTNWSMAQAQRIYKCFDTTIAGSPVQPRQLQPGADVWSFWLSRMQITTTEIALGDYPCLTALPPVGENDGTVLNGRLGDVVPFAIEAYIAQTNSAVIIASSGISMIDQRGPARLVGIRLQGASVQSPIVGGVLNAAFPFRRDVYNLVPTGALGESPTVAAFVGTGSATCAATAVVNGNSRRVIELFGFGYRPTTMNPLDRGCGAV